MRWCQEAQARRAMDRASGVRAGFLEVVGLEGWAGAESAGRGWELSVGECSSGRFLGVSAGRRHQVADTCRNQNACLNSL